MCGIVGYVGAHEASEILVGGLQRLEYRGYDSAGLAVYDGERLNIARAVGKLVNLSRNLREKPLSGTIGIGHTRWATHGRPLEHNAHPHTAGPITVVHNGIIENHLPLKVQLEARGHTFLSETDTEIFCHAIREQVEGGLDLLAATRAVCAQVEGSYALVVFSALQPDRIVAARNASPLVLGIGEGEMFLASDVPALLAHTRSFIFLNDGDFVELDAAGYRIEDRQGQPQERPIRHIAWTPSQAEKGGYKHFMLKEIYEQPRALADTLRGRFSLEQGRVDLDALGLSGEQLCDIDRIVLCACGTAWHSALVGRRLIEQATRIICEVDLASEFRYRDPIVTPRTLLIAISQSGETADTLAALREAKARGARTLAVCNVMESSIAREADQVLYTHAGPEIGVASTKAFTTQLVALSLLSLAFAQCAQTMSPEAIREALEALVTLPGLVEEQLQDAHKIEEVARRYMHARDFLYLGRGINHAIALEGALKLKEISYIHAEGYAAGEMKHGPIALIDEAMPVVVISPKGPHYEKTVSNLQEVRARQGLLIAIATQGDTQLAELADDVLYVPEVPERLQPLIMTIPLQLLAYHIADLKGTDVDQPRNLAKSVTVE